MLLRINQEKPLRYNTNSVLVIIEREIYFKFTRERKSVISKHLSLLGRDELSSIRNTPSAPEKGGSMIERRLKNPSIAKGNIAGKIPLHIFSMLCSSQKICSEGIHVKRFTCSMPYDISTPINIKKVLAYPYFQGNIEKSQPGPEDDDPAPEDGGGVDENKDPES